MKAIDLRNKYINFFKNNNHAYIPSAPLLPENDPTVLFTTAGMHPLVPYLLGEVHPQGKRLVDYQKCLRTDDIEEVGDASHLTFFEMMGNWSLGDYFKKDSIKYSFDFLMKELNIDVNKISVTCYEGDVDVPKDTESAEIWEALGIPKERIHFFGRKENWWGPVGNCGPCGPDTEIFYDTGKDKCSDECNPSCSCGKYVEIWNNVFLQYNKTEGGKYLPLQNKCVDTGLGLERVSMILQGKKSVFDIEIFTPIMNKLKELAKNNDIDSMRIVTEHLRASIMLIADGVVPSNVEQGYILRRLIRRVIRHLRKLEIELEQISDLIDIYIYTLQEMYPELIEKKNNIKVVIEEEKNKFAKTLENGEKEFNKIVEKLKKDGKNIIDGAEVFKLYETYGFPPEITEELAKETSLEIDNKVFDELFKKHQEMSRLGAEQKFKGGMLEQTDTTIKYHTATHLLHKALQIVLGEHAKQKGSNITEERLRFDFAQPEKVTKEQLEEVEKIVNEQIMAGLEVKCEEMSLEEARDSGAMGLFENKYGEKVKVYSIGEFSKEICGGPHVENTKILGKFKIQKEEASSSGVRRIKAILE